MSKAIGFIDSGVGGLTGLKEALKQLPHESMIFLGDSARCPYGNRTVEEIRKFTKEMVQFLLKKDVKMIVIACNTATAVVLEELQEMLDIPVVGVIQPGSLAAIKQTKTQKIAVLGTHATIQSDVYRKTLQKKNHELRVTSLECPKFVPLVESNQTDSPIAKKVVAQTLQPLMGKEFDTLILGCTHYPLLKDAISKIYPNIKIVDPAKETALDLKNILQKNEFLKNDAKKNEEVKYYVTDGREKFKEIGIMFLEENINEVELIKL